MKPILFFFAFMLAFISGPTPSAQAASLSVAGRWKITTKLVVAQDPTNPNYHVGDKRIETWTIKTSKNKATLKTPAGTIAGTKVGKAWVFDQTYDTGYGVLTHMHIVVRQTNSRAMKGTIEVRYYSAQFGYEIGVDAWSFTGTKR